MKQWMCDGGWEWWAEKVNCLIVSDRLTKSSDGTTLHQHACLEWHVAMMNWWVIILQFQEGLLQAPMNPPTTTLARCCNVPWRGHQTTQVATTLSHYTTTLPKQIFHGGRQVFQVGQAPSGSTVIRPVRPPQYGLAPGSWPLTFSSWKWCPSQVRQGLPPCQFQSS